MLQVQVTDNGEPIAEMRFTPDGARLVVVGLYGGTYSLTTSDGVVQQMLPRLDRWFERHLIQVTDEMALIYQRGRAMEYWLVEAAEGRHAFAEFRGGTWSGSAGTTRAVFRNRYGLFAVDCVTRHDVAERFLFERPSQIIPAMSYSGERLCTYRTPLASGPAAPGTRGPFIHPVDRLGEKVLLPGPTQGIMWPDFSWRDSYFAAVAFNTLWVWSLDDGRIIRQQRAEAGSFGAIRFVSDERFLVAINRKDAAEIAVFDATQGCVVDGMNHGISYMSALTVAPTGLTAAAGDRHGRVTVWDLEG